MNCTSPAKPTVVNGRPPASDSPAPREPQQPSRLHRKLLPGEGVLEVTRSAQHSMVTRAAAQTPMRLFVPPRKSLVPLVYTSSYGGGLLAGDQTNLSVLLKAGSRCVLSSQASTKIYRNPSGLPCSQTIRAQVEPEALLVLAPEPISCFRDSSYDQTQRFDVAENGNLVLIDWMTSGRYGVGERYQFTHYDSRQSIYYGQRHLIEDAVRLTPRQLPLDCKFRLGNYNCVALMVILGSLFSELGERLLAAEQEQALGRGGRLISVVQPLPHEAPGALIRVVSEEAQDARFYFERLLAQIDPILGAETWAGKL